MSNEQAAITEIMSSEKFPRHIVEKLGWYVYALQDPRSRRVFYIGKGKGNRVFAHANFAQIEKGLEGPKSRLIKESLDSGHKVEAIVLRHALNSEAEAFQIESVLIDFCHFLDESHGLTLCDLTNLVRGHDHSELGIMNAETLMSLYHAPKCPKINERAILFRIPVRWSPEISRESLYESTSGWWRLGARREDAEIALAVSNGIVRGVYVINSWRPRQRGDRGWTDTEKPNTRWGFSGRDISDSSPYMNRDVQHLFLSNSQNPVTYQNL